jgi:hypothetical protein
MERGGARVEGRCGGHHVVDQDEMQPAQRGAIRRRTERARYVAPTLTRCQPRLRFRCTAASEKIGTHRNAPQTREHSREFLTLVVTAFTLSRSRERHGHQRCPLSLDIRRKTKVRHSSRHSRRDRWPPMILERMDDAFGIAAGHRISRSNGAHIGRQQLTPRAFHSATQWIEWMSTPVAAWTRQLLSAEPTRTTDELRFVCSPCIAAYAARGRQQQVEERRARSAQDGRYEIAFHIAVRSGSMPNHMRKAMTPCSISIPRPSAARCPASRAAPTQGVSVL